MTTNIEVFRKQLTDLMPLPDTQARHDMLVAMMETMVVTVYEHSGNDMEDTIVGLRALAAEGLKHLARELAK